MPRHSDYTDELADTKPVIFMTPAAIEVSGGLMAAVRNFPGFKIVVQRSRPKPSPIGKPRKVKRG